MPLTDLKISKKDQEKKKKDMGTCYPSSKDENPYPYFTRMRFDKDYIPRIPGLADLVGGDRVRIVAEALVKSTEVSSTDKNKKETPTSVEIEFHKMSVAKISGNDLKEGFDDEEGEPD